MKEVHILVTEHAKGRTEGVPELLSAEGVKVTVVRNYLEEALPELKNVDGIISGGGPMGVYEIKDGSYDFLKGEQEYLLRAIYSGKAILGLCLGHQLLASVLGGNIAKSLVQAEYGWSKITLNKEGVADPLFKEIPSSFQSFEFHKDAVLSLPKEAITLATSLSCPIQAFRYSTYPVWGVQFHPEISPQKAEVILRARPEVIEATGLDVFLAIDKGYSVNHQPRKQIFYNFLQFLR